MNKVLAMLLCGALAGTICAADIPDLKKSMAVKGVGEVDGLMDEDGLTVIELKGTTEGNDKNKGNKYLNFNIDLPEAVDLTGKALVVRAKTDTPDIIAGLYVRAFNDGNAKTPVLSYNVWKPVLKTDYIDILLIPGENGLLQWEKAVVSGDPANAVKRLQFHIGTPKELSTMNLKIKSVKVIDDPRVVFKTATAGMGEFKAIAKSRFAATGTVKAAMVDGVATMICESRSLADAKQTNQYDGLAFSFANPVDLAGKTIKFEYKATGPVLALYIRFFDAAGKKPLLSFVSKVRPANEWTAVELKGGADSDKFSWQPTEVSGDEAKAVTTADFIFCTPDKAADFGIQVRNLRAE